MKGRKKNYRKSFNINNDDRQQQHGAIGKHSLFTTMFATNRGTLGRNRFRDLMPMDFDTHVRFM